MQEAMIPLLISWQSFFVIVGTAAATLTGLMFVVVTLAARLQDPRVKDAVPAFNTPNVVHFCAALLVAAILSAPWQVLWNASLLLGLCGLGGVIYVIIVFERLRRQKGYQPVLEDWLWHVIFPFASYLALVAATFVLPGNSVPMLFVVGAASMLLLFIGIHNAWDLVTYATFQIPPGSEQ